MATADVYHQLGMVAQEQRRFADAEQVYRMALELKLEFNDRLGAASSYLQLGSLGLEQARFSDAAISFVAAAVSWYSETGLWASNAVEPLARLRDHLEEDEFGRLVGDNVPAELLNDLRAAISQAAP